MSLTAIRQRLLTINNTKAYVQFDAKQTVQLFAEIKRYLRHGDGQLASSQQMALMEMLFYLAIFCGEDVEAEVVYNQVRDKLGGESCKLQVMKATLLQFNESVEVAIKYLEGILREEYEFNTDMASYTALSKKLLSLRMYYGKGKDNTTSWIQEINTLLEKCPLDPELWWFLAQLYKANKQYEYAIHSLQEVLLIMPFNYIAFAQLSELYVYHSLNATHKDKVAILQLALGNALRSVELSETYLKGWTLVKIICEKLDDDKSTLIGLANKKLIQIEQTSNENDKFIANYILSQ
ncbi:ER membrane protein complex subunit 2 [Monosporozyma unispora]|nr:hypothetical protein C6P44_000458 [Kazachstania unispora]